MVYDTLLCNRYVGRDIIILVVLRKGNHGDLTLDMIRSDDYIHGRSANSEEKAEQVMGANLCIKRKKRMYSHQKMART